MSQKDEYSDYKIAESRITSFREPNSRDYPELIDYSKTERYDYFIGCGGLYLATQMARRMKLQKGDIVLDLGCGYGPAAMFLAKHYGVTVIAVDLWFSSEKIQNSIVKEKLGNQIIPLNVDMTKYNPFASNYFDAIFCMNSFFLYGESEGLFESLLRTLKSGGVFCVGSEGFNIEPQFFDKKDIPEAYNFEWSWNVWDDCYSKYHSPEWWHSRIQKADLLDSTNCIELEDGRILWEDMAKNYKEYINDEILSLGAVVPQEKVIEQILYGEATGLWPTLYVISGIKK